MINGRRSPGVSLGGAPAQPDINGIPLSAIERIEILPTTASGIYGGSATGGVINIILRSDYQGAQFSANYGNTFESGAATRTVDMSFGSQLEDGKTNLSLSASWTDNSDLQMQDRDFLDRGLATVQANNPAFFLTGTPPLGTTTNIRSVDGSPLFGPGTPSFTFVPAGYAGRWRH